MNIINVSDTAEYHNVIGDGLPSFLKYLKHIQVIGNAHKHIPQRIANSFDIGITSILVLKYSHGVTSKSSYGVAEVVVKLKGDMTSGPLRCVA